MSFALPTLGFYGFVFIALIFDFLNGFNDSANIVATIISSRAISPSRALLIAAIFEFLGPFLFGVAVATTIGHQVVAPDILSTQLVFTALGAAIFWNLFTWRMGIPSSSSHALIGGLVGSACMASLFQQLKGAHLRQGSILRAAFRVVQIQGLTKVVLSLLISPLLGFVAGFFIIKITYFFARLASPKINSFFRKVQLLTSIGLALAHGANDAQKTMALIAMALFASGRVQSFSIPFWVVLCCAGAISLGTAIGGRRQIKTIGSKFYKIRPIHGFTTQLSSSLLIITASLIGGPVSTSHVVSSAVMGAGSAERISKVRWGVGRQIVTAWLLTMPITALIASIFYLAIQLIIK